MFRAAMALAAACPLLAAADDSSPVQLAPVTVVGQHTELEDSGVVIRVPVAPLGASDLADLLDDLPGVQVRTSGGLGSYSEASLRGSSGREVRILLDGLPLDTGGGEATSLSLVSPLLLDEVDIYKGRVPVGLGSGLAGTINLHSRRQLAAPVVGTATLGSYGQRQLDLAIQPLPAWQLALGGQAADNNFRYLNPYSPFNPADPNRTVPQERQNDGTRQYYGLLRYLGSLDVTANAVDDVQHLPTRSNAPNTNVQLDTQSYALSASTPADSAWQSALSQRLTRETYLNPDAQLGVGAEDTVSNTERSLFSLGRRFSDVQDTLTAERIGYTAENKIGTTPTTLADRYDFSNGLAAQFGDARRYNASLTAGWSHDGADGSHDDHVQFEPAAGISQRFSTCLASGNLGHRERLPTFFERYGDRGLFVGNPDLQPETATYGDVGGHCSLGVALNRVELTFFGQDLHNAISPTFNAQGIGHSVNSSHGEIYGTEAASSGSLLGFGWELSGTWQHTEDLSDAVATHDKQLPGRFRTQLNTRIERHLYGLVFYYAYRLEAGEYYDSPNILKAPALQRHDVGVRGDVYRVGWSLQALNLANSNIQQFNGFPTPGRRIVFSVTYPDVASQSPPFETFAPPHAGTPPPSANPSTPGVPDDQQSLPADPSQPPPGRL